MKMVVKKGFKIYGKNKTFLNFI